MACIYDVVLGTPLQLLMCSLHYATEIKTYIPHSCFGPAIFPRGCSSHVRSPQTLPAAHADRSSRLASPPSPELRGAPRLLQSAKVREQK